MKRLVLGGGCFWCTEAVFLNVKGVKKVGSGYTGGMRPNPTYQQICTGATGHAEIVDISYDENIISLENLLEIFFVIHDPTTLNQQGADRGTQYRSVIYFSDDDEKEFIDSVIAKAENNFDDKIVTEISRLGDVYPAEEYHQNYYRLNESQGYCQVVIAPKLQKFMTSFPQMLG